LLFDQVVSVVIPHPGLGIAHSFIFQPRFAAPPALFRPAGEMI
jgi:hypothetical protein